MASSQSVDQEHFLGGAEPTAEPRSQDTARGGRGIGLSLTSVLGALLIAVPVVWAILYLTQAGAAGLGGGFMILVGVVLVACVGTGWLLVRGLFRT
jgi:hypothetical protein